MGRTSDRPAPAGYSGTPLPKKLGIRPGATVLLLGAPDDFPQTLGPLPEGATLRTKAASPVPLILLFVKSRAELARRFPAGRKAFAPKASMWIAWPKQASGIATDLKESVVREFGLVSGLVDYKVCAIDHIWSGLLFTERRA